MINSIIKGKFLIIGKGVNIKSICYVENLIDFTYHIDSRLMQSGTFNYADFPHYNIKDIVLAISKIIDSKIFSIPYALAYSIGLFFDFLSIFTKKELNITSNRIKKFCHETSLSTKKIEDLNFKPTFSFIEAINKTIK